MQNLTSVMAEYTNPVEMLRHSKNWDVSKVSGCCA